MHTLIVSPRLDDSRRAGPRRLDLHNTFGTAAHVHTLIVSPHLDDAVLSCAGRLASAQANGERATVVTLFSSGAPLHRRRRKEDRAALGQLGAELVHVGLADAPWRVVSARPLTLASLLLSSTPAPDDVASARRALAPILEQASADRVLFPLGVGGHVDHLVAFACSDLVPTPRFYEDRPYAFVPALVARRLHALEGGSARATPSDAEVRSQLERAAFSDASLLERAVAIAASLARSTASRRRWSVIEERDVSQHAARASAAVESYGSQMRALFGDRSVAEVWSEQAAHVERLWAPAPQ